MEKNEKYISKVFGPTCDALDVIAANMYLPQLNIGDWLFFPDFGAYTVAASSTFNGFTTVKMHYIWRN